MSPDPTTPATPAATDASAAPAASGTAAPTDTPDASGLLPDPSAAPAAGVPAADASVAPATPAATDASVAPALAAGAATASVRDAVTVRPARTTDVRAIRSLVDTYAPDRRLLSKATVTLYEDVPDFLVVELDGRVVACGAVHVIWEDLAEVRTVAVDPALRGRGIGAVLLDHLVARARSLGVQKVFCLTFETDFFASRGFVEIEGTPVDHDVYAQLLQSYDEGVAEFLDLERVKPNTLGNHRMLLHL